MMWHQDYLVLEVWTLGFWFVCSLHCFTCYLSHTAIQNWLTVDSMVSNILYDH